MNTQINIQDALKKAGDAKFEHYASFNEGLQHEILTCTQGKHSGEVIDIYWNYKTGIIHTVDYSAQFKGQLPTFRL
jgi:hypothetical protein